MDDIRTFRISFDLITYNSELCEKSIQSYLEEILDDNNIGIIDNFIDIYEI